MPLRERGAVLMAVLVTLLLALTIVPMMVLYAQRESLWTAKEARTTRAFHLAESGVEKAYLTLSQSSALWQTVQNGGTVPDFHFDRSFSDLAGGTYAVSITSGPGTKQTTVISVGRDSLFRETRAIQVVYDDASLENTLIYSEGAVHLAGNVDVEWGAIVSQDGIDTGGRAHPQFWSAGAITPFDTNPDPPNCDSPDCCQWHSFDPKLPASPTIDLSMYQSSAAATNTLYSSTAAWSAFTDWSGSTFFITSDLFISPPGIDVIGNVIVLGNLSTASGNFGSGTHALAVPRNAWKQYCNDWAAYQVFDPGAPAAFPGLSSGYLSAPGLTYTRNKLAVVGLLYVGGNFNVGGGGGQSAIDGALFVVGQSSITSNSHVTLYFNSDAAANLSTSGMALSRSSWRETLASWPSGL